jgi:ubiquitin carboxyl-terminal hydrolase L3
MLSTEDWALEMIPQPVLGVLFLYEVTPVQSEHSHNQDATLHPEQVPQDIFFMKQYAQNACGTIGLFHIILNALKNHPDIILPESYLEKFKN